MSPTVKGPGHRVKDMSLAPHGALRIDWAAQQMPVLVQIRERFAQELPLKGKRIASCLHVTTETANLLITLKAGGAEVVVCASNPLSTQDDVAASLVEDHGIPTYAIKGEDREAYHQQINWCLDIMPHIITDDGGDLIANVHTTRMEVLQYVLGATEETTTGVLRLRNMEKQQTLRFPVIAINDANTKQFFDNRYGTGQSTIDGLLRATNVLLAGKRFVVAGYGWCSRGIASRARGMGARVVVTEVDPLRALEAVMDGFDVMSMEQAAGVGDIFVTATGNKGIIRKEHFERMKDGVILANSGHFNVEIDIPALETMAATKRSVRDFVEEYKLSDGRRFYLLGEGRLVNLAAAEGHPAQVMDMSFANQALSVEYILNVASRLEKKVYRVPVIDREIARLKLISMGVLIDTPTEDQKHYLVSWEMGT